MELAVGIAGMVVDEGVRRTHFVADPHPFLPARAVALTGDSVAGASEVIAWPGRLKRTKRLVSVCSRSPG
jgi:hypothetical protein